MSTDISKLQNTFEKLLNNKIVRESMDFLQADADNTLEQQKELVVIEAPTFHEENRAKHYAKMLTAAGLEDVKIDDRFNVYGIIRGTGNTGKAVLIEGHLDTVFGFGDVKGITEKDGKLYAPGICDDTRALAANLSVLRAFQHNGIKPVHDIIVAGMVAEEGLGGMSGMKYFLEDKPYIIATISIDGTGADKIVYNATGIINYEVTYKGPGGHAYTAFGLPSPNHAMGRAIAALADMQVPTTPKTTFTVSLVKGGHAIHAIAQKAAFKINMRSDCPKELAKLEDAALKIFCDAAICENGRWDKEDIVQVEAKKILDVPAGFQADESPIVQAAILATKALGINPILVAGGCTNSNMPISIGIPAVTLGRGGAEGGIHSLDEWFDPTGVYVCEQKSLLMLLALAGLTDVTEPIDLK